MKQPLDTLIRTIRDQKVLLDADLAAIYGVPTKALNQAVKHNSDRFPADFRFQLTRLEWEELNRSQIVTTSAQASEPLPDEALRSQSVTLKKGRGQRRKYLPYAFTAIAEKG